MLVASLPGVRRRILRLISQNGGKGAPGLLGGVGLVVEVQKMNFQVEQKYM